MPDHPLPAGPDGAPLGASASPDALATGRHAALLVDVVALTADLDLYDAAREAVGERNPVWRARSAEEAADLLISGRCGVLLLDMAAVSARADTLISQIVEQFPDVVICVAGERSDEPLLAPLLSDGLVYRFMHKPATPKRAGMFLQAAIRHHVERREGRVTDDPFAPLLRSLRQPTAGWRQAYVVLALLVALAFALPFALEHTLFRGETPETAATVAPLIDPGTRADPVLSRARAALQAGRLDAPEGRNSLDLFRAVLLAQPENAEAQDGLRQTIDALLTRAEQDLAAGRDDAARQTVERVAAVSPGNERAGRLAGRIDPPDTPSQQLAREQVAEATLAPLVAAGEPTTPLPEPAVRSPVAGSAPVTAAPAPAAVPRPTTVAPVRNALPQPDPLAPRYVNAAPATPLRAGRVTRPPTYSAPAGPRHDIAGYTRPVVEPAAAEPEPPPGPAVAADQFDRVAARDPEYPLQALQAGINGWVELEFTIAPSGGVRDIQVVGAEPQGVFDAAAREALAQWRFRPRYVNGQPVAQRSTITMRFDVER
jgi:protein TonB